MVFNMNNTLNVAVRTTLGEMVKRELKLANNKSTESHTSDIEASFRTVAVCKTPSWNSSHCTLS